MTKTKTEQLSLFPEIQATARVFEDNKPWRPDSTTDATKFAYLSAFVENRNEHINN